MVGMFCFVNGICIGFGSFIYVVVYGVYFVEWVKSSQLYLLCKQFFIWLLVEVFYICVYERKIGYVQLLVLNVGQLEVFLIGNIIVCLDIGVVLFVVVGGLGEDKGVFLGLQVFQAFEGSMGYLLFIYIMCFVVVVGVFVVIVVYIIWEGSDVDFEDSWFIYIILKVIDFLFVV